MSVRDCKGPLWGCLWFVAGWAGLMVFIFANISRPWLYFLSVYNSMVWILIRFSAQACFISEMLLIASSLMLLTKTSLLDLKFIFSSQNQSQEFTAWQMDFQGNFRSANQWVRKGEGVSQGVKHAYQCSHPKQLQPCTLHKPACDGLESLSFSVISLRQLLHPLAYKKKKNKLMRKKHMLTDGGCI